MLRSGTLLNSRYKVGVALGQGGFGTVYRAHDNSFQMSVAIKEMSPEAGWSEQLRQKLREQFYREARTLVQLHHTHLVRVSDYFSQFGNDYLVMRFVDGQSMARLIDQRGAIDEQTVLKWANQLLDALAYCHKNRILHRATQKEPARMGYSTWQEMYGSGVAIHIVIIHT